MFARRRSPQNNRSPALAGVGSVRRAQTPPPRTDHALITALTIPHGERGCDATSCGQSRRQEVARRARSRQLPLVPEFILQSSEPLSTTESGGAPLPTLPGFPGDWRFPSDGRSPAANRSPAVAGVRGAGSRSRWPRSRSTMRLEVGFGDALGHQHDRQSALLAAGTAPAHGRPVLLAPARGERLRHDHFIPCDGRGAALMTTSRRLSVSAHRGRGSRFTQRQHYGPSALLAGRSRADARGAL